MGWFQAKDRSVDVIRTCERCSNPLPVERLRYPNSRFCSEDCRWRFYHAKHRPTLREYSKKWRKDNPDKVAATLNKHRPKRLESLKAWKARNPERVKELRRLSAKRCEASAKKRRARWIEKHPEKMRDARNKWRTANPWKVAANKRNRQLVQSHATPAWLTEQQYVQIEEFYRKASELSKATGIPHEVDHIIPIRGKQVCGLHVPWNLQVLTSTDNRRKSARVYE